MTSQAGDVQFPQPSRHDILLQTCPCFRSQHDHVSDPNFSNPLLFICIIFLFAFIWLFQLLYLMMNSDGLNSWCLPYFTVTSSDISHITLACVSQSFSVKLLPF